MDGAPVTFKFRAYPGFNSWLLGLSMKGLKIYQFSENNSNQEFKIKQISIFDGTDEEINDKWYECMTQFIALSKIDEEIGKVELGVIDQNTGLF